MEVIEVYIAQLDAALRGRRRARVDLLADTRQPGGCHRGVRAGRDGARGGWAPCRGNVRPLDEITAAYQDEISVAQGRRTALLTFFVLAPQPIVWNSAFSPVPSADPAPAYAAIDGLVVARRRLPWLTAFLLLPLSVVAVSARACLRTG